MNKKVDPVLAVGLILVMVMVCWMLIWAYSIIQKPINTYPSALQPKSLAIKNETAENSLAEKSIPELGKECNYASDLSKINTNGLQCYLFSFPKDDPLSMPKTGGLWIYPNTPNYSSPHVDYFTYIKNFKEYSNSDLYFKYPIGSRLDDTWKNNGIIELTMGDPEIEPSGISIKLYNDEFDKEKFVESLKTEHNYAKIINAANCGEGCNSIRMTAIPSINAFSNGATYYIVFPRENKYILVTAWYHDDSYADFLTEAFLQSIRIK